ncbi:MAG: bifunctional folylpolyglutamate synthase/dihydrofolate synthase [Pontiellaceae bacterium]|nr:bifunctional folylpolyglutamate synthase/dihydrofolate synthase [Pontiellaceae bacterium]
MSPSYERLFKRTTAGIKPGLEVISALLESLGNPHQKLAVIHVAGTNGKGSVCAMLESVLRATGFKSGLYTSPHLVDFSERFRINGEPIVEAQLDRYIDQMEQAADAVEAATGLRGATFFEISTAIAFQYFADEQVDIAIVETGMGGRWDATNVVIPLLSVITHIDIDHTNFLGDSIEKIAAEKAGIMKPGRPTVSAPQSDEVMRVLAAAGPVQFVDGSLLLSGTTTCSVMRLGPLHHNEASCFVQSQRLKIETPSRSLPPINLPLLGAFQRENCAVAVTALELLAELLDIEPAYKKGLETVEWSARFQILCTDPLTILDGAHNPSGARALIKTFKENYPKHQIGFIFGFLADKDAVEFLRILKPRVTAAWTIPIVADRGTTAEQSAAQAGVAGISAEPLSVADAWNAARSWASVSPDRLICITGSLYLKQMLSTSLSAEKSF